MNIRAAMSKGVKNEEIEKFWECYTNNIITFEKKMVRGGPTEAYARK